MSWRDEAAPCVVKKLLKRGDADPFHGLFEVRHEGRLQRVEYEPDPELRDSEQVPLLEPGGIEAFIRREVLPHFTDAWIDKSATKTGYEISFTRHFYKPQKLRTLDAIRDNIIALEKETTAILTEIIGANLR
jgi:type I restriction enzyme M protein